MDYITTSNIVLAWRCYNYATTVYTVYTVYSTVKFVYNKSSGILSKFLYSSGFSIYSKYIFLNY